MRKCSRSLVCSSVMAVGVALPLAAQGPAPMLKRTVAHAQPASAKPHWGGLPDTARKYPATYWKEGLLIGGGIAGFFGAALAGGLCSMSESANTNCTLSTIGGFVLLGGAGGSVGALVGGAFPKTPRNSTPTMETRPVRADACAPAESGRHLLAYVRELVSATDSLPQGNNATRRLYKLPRLDPSRVVMVTDPETCSRAAEAYTRVTPDFPPLEHPVGGRRMHVIRAGKRYVVEDPFTPARAGEFQIWAVFTTDWRLVARVFS